MAKVLEGVQVDLTEITLLEQAGRDNLMNFANSGIGQIDYPGYLAEVTCLAVQECVCVPAVWLPHVEAKKNLNNKYFFGDSFFSFG